MKRKLSAATIGLLLALPFCVHAQQSQRQADPADPGAAVPPTVYESAFTASPKQQHEHPTPDKAWRAANEAVAGAQGHAGHGAHAAPEKTTPHEGHGAPQAPAKPADPPAADHSKHH